MTPSFAVGSRPRRLSPPRTLNAAVGSTLSHFSSARVPTAADTASRWTSGVGRRYGRRNSRAARTSANVTGSALTSRRVAGTDARLPRVLDPRRASGSEKRGVQKEGVFMEQFRARRKLIALLSIEFTL